MTPGTEATPGRMPKYERALRSIHLLTALLELFRVEYTDDETGRLHVVNNATDDQKFSQTFAPADAAQVPVEANVAITVTVQDAGGNDLSKWVDVQQDPANPNKFAYTRKPDDGSQPSQLDFTAVATATVNGAAVGSLKTDFSFTPGAVAGLTATTTVEPLTPAA